MKLRIVFAASIALVVLAAVSPAFAGKGRPGGSTTGARVTFDPSSAVVGQQYRVNGTGFRANTWVSVGAHFADTTWWGSQVTDGQGKFSLVFTATSAGQVLHEAKEMGNNGRLRLRATATLSVSPAP